MTVERGMRWRDCSAFFGFISVKVFYELLLTIYVFLANEIADKNIKYDGTKLPKKMFGKTAILNRKSPDERRNWATQLKTKLQRYDRENVNLLNIKVRVETQKGLSGQICKKFRDKNGRRVLNSFYGKAYKNISKNELEKLN